MKQLFVLLFILISIHTFSQDSLQNFDFTRNSITIKGMKVLASWGIANISVSAAGWASSHGTNKYFFQMNTMWGTVNTGLAVLGIISSKKKLHDQLNAFENLKAQQRIEKTFLINTGLDVAYTGAGLYFNIRGNNSNNAQLKGFGSSVIMQGLFLFLFDGTMYKIQSANGKKFRRGLSKL